MNCLLKANIIPRFYFPTGGTAIQYQYNENTFFENYDSRDVWNGFSPKRKADLNWTEIQIEIF